MSRVLPPTFKPVNKLICCKFDVGGKTRNIAIQLVLQQRSKTSWTFFVARISVPKRFLALHSSCMHLDLIFDQ